MDTVHAGHVAYSRDLTGRSTVAGVFKDRHDAERAIEALRDAGFSREQIGIAMRDRTAQGEMVEETGTHAAGGAAAGIVGGGLLGALAGFLVATGALAIPGIGPVVAGGVLASTFGIVGGTAVAGAGIGAAAGGILGALIGMGIPEHEARHFEHGVRSGGTLVTVTAPGRAADAVAILERFGGDTGASLYGGTAAQAAQTPLGAATSGQTPVGTASAPQVPEQPVVNSGEYVVRKRVVQDTQTIQVPVTREEYIVERPDGTPIDDDRHRAA
jgi:hypothetical protein